MKIVLSEPISYPAMTTNGPETVTVKELELREQIKMRDLEDWPASFTATAPATKLHLMKLAVSLSNQPLHVFREMGSDWLEVEKAVSNFLAKYLKIGKTP